MKDDPLPIFLNIFSQVDVNFLHLENLLIFLLIIILLVFFLAQMPRKPQIIVEHPYRRNIVYVNNPFPIWRIPTGWARPIRRKIRHVPMRPLVPAHHLLGPGGIHRL